MLEILESSTARTVLMVLNWTSECPHHVVVDVEMLVLVMEHLDKVEHPGVAPRPPGHEAEGGRGVGQGAQPLVEAGQLVRGQAEVN